MRRGKDQGRVFAHRPLAIIYYNLNKQAIIHDVRERLRVLPYDKRVPKRRPSHRDEARFLRVSPFTLDFRRFSLLRTKLCDNVFSLTAAELQELAFDEYNKERTDQNNHCVRPRESVDLRHSRGNRELGRGKYSTASSSY
jgi:hypothetical protein